MKPRAAAGLSHKAWKRSLAVLATVSALVLVAAGCGGADGSGGVDVDPGVEVVEETEPTTTTTATTAATTTTAPAATVADAVTAVSATEPPEGALGVVCPEEPVEWVSPSEVLRVAQEEQRQAEAEAREREFWRQNPDAVGSHPEDFWPPVEPEFNTVADAKDVTALLELEERFCMTAMRLGSHVLAESVDQLGEVLAQVSQLVIFGGETTELPDELFDYLGDLVSLELTSEGSVRWKLRRLSDRLGELKNLERLEVRATDLIELPDSLGDLTSLKYLVIGSNHSLERLPDSIGQLTSLVSLRIYNNTGLVSVPESLGELQNLVSLDISSIDNVEVMPVGVLDLCDRVSCWISGYSQSDSMIGEPPVRFGRGAQG